MDPEPLRYYRRSNPIAWIIAVGFYLTVGFMVTPVARAETPPAPAGHRAAPKWKLSEWRQLGERRASVGFGVWPKEPILVIHVSRVDAKQIPSSKLKLTVLDAKGKKLKTARYYEYPNLISFDGYATGFFQVGTFVERVSPEQVSTVAVEGFGGRLTVRFVDGHAQADGPN